MQAISARKNEKVPSFFDHSLCSCARVPIFAPQSRAKLSDWALSSAGSERLPYKQRVGGSNPSAPTTIYYGFQIAAIHLLMSCCCFILCSRWKGRGKSSALVGRWWSKGKRACAGGRKLCDRVGKCPISLGRWEEKKEAREEGGKTRRLLPENGLLFAKSSEEIRKCTRG